MFTLCFCGMVSPYDLGDSDIYRERAGKGAGGWTRPITLDSTVVACGRDARKDRGFSWQMGYDRPPDVTQAASHPSIIEYL